jgi:hypothetical protein
MLYVGNSSQQTVEITQERNKELVTQNWTFVIINTVNFMIDSYTHFKEKF